MTQSTSEIIENLLPKHKKRKDEDWTLWEHKTLNIHRAILHWEPAAELSYPAMSEAVRNKIDETYKISFWRGFAYGVIIDISYMPDKIDMIAESIDTRDNNKGTWQWVILICSETKSIIAIHTWVAGFLTPIYEAVLSSYASLGYKVGDFKKEKDKLMKFLTEIAALKGVRFREYESK